MVKTVVIGGFDQLNARIDTILGGATPNIVQIVEPRNGYFIILHKA